VAFAVGDRALDSAGAFAIQRHGFGGQGSALGHSFGRCGSASLKQPLGTLRIFFAGGDRLVPVVDGLWLAYGHLRTRFGCFSRLGPLGRCGAGRLGTIADFFWSTR